MKQLIGLVILSLHATCWAEPWRLHTVDNSSRGADGVRLADVNGDGLPDIATGWEEGGRVRAYLNPGPDKANASWPSVTVGNVASPEDALFVDLDRDGASDVVSCCEGRNRTVYAHWAPRDPDHYLRASAWNTAAFDCSKQQQSWMFALPMQVDGRRGIDLVVGSKGKGASIGWLESPADPRDMSAWKFHPVYNAGWIMSLQAYDMDGDGDQDVLASDRKGPTRGLLWLENRGANLVKRPWPIHRLGGEDREVMFLALTEQLTAGRRSLVCAVRSRGLLLVPDTAAVTRVPLEIPMPNGCGTGKAVAVGDLDLDGQHDIVFSCENARGDKSGVRWLSRSRRGSWKDHEISGPRGVKFDRLELLDLDADGDLDLLTCEETRNLGVIWYENPVR